MKLVQQCIEACGWMGVSGVRRVCPHLKEEREKDCDPEGTTEYVTYRCGRTGQLLEPGWDRIEIPETCPLAEWKGG